MRINTMSFKKNKKIKWLEFGCVGLLFAFILFFCCIFFIDTAYCMDPDNDLTAFVEEYYNTQEKLLDVIEGGAPDEMKNPQHLSKIHLPNTILTKLKLYDLLGSITESGGNRVEGTLMLTKYDAFKEINGNNINFGYDYVYDTTRPHLYKKGDKIVERGTLNTESMQLNYRFYKERDGVILEDTILELEKLENGDGLLQYLFWKDGVLKTCIFMRYNETESNFIVADGDRSEVLEYNSILGRDVSPGEMVAGYTKLLQVNIEGDKMQYQEEF